MDFLADFAQEILAGPSHPASRVLPEKQMWINNPYIQVMHSETTQFRHAILLLLLVKLTDIVREIVVKNNLTEALKQFLKLPL